MGVPDNGGRPSPLPWPGRWSSTPAKAPRAPRSSTGGPVRWPPCCRPRPARTWRAHEESPLPSPAAESVRISAPHAELADGATVRRAGLVPPAQPAILVTGRLRFRRLGRGRPDRAATDRSVRRAAIRIPGQRPDPPVQIDARTGDLAMRRTIPCIRQMEDADCGAACLAMVLDYFDKRVDLSELRDMTGASRDGVTALSIVNAARAYRLRARGVKADIDDLRHVPRGSILHWEFSHFVVFERITRHGARIVDPAHGRRIVSTERAAPRVHRGRDRLRARGRLRPDRLRGQRHLALPAADAQAIEEHGQGPCDLPVPQARRARAAPAHRARRRRDRPARRPSSSPRARPRRRRHHRLQLLVLVPARQPAGRAADPP